MRLAYTDEQEKTRHALRVFYDELLDPETRAALAEQPHGEVMRRCVKRMVEEGWYGIGWPEEYGGGGGTHVEQFIFFDESMRARAPVPMLGINTVGPALREFGTEEQKRRFLPAILAGDVFFCIGYSEPGSGTDLASLRTAAVRDGDEYVITGQKMWTSLADTADYCWLAVRTDPAADKHRGISIIVVPMDTPGITLRPLDLLGQHPIAAVHYDDVRVPVENLVGAENEGWRLITSQLNHERVTLASPGMIDRLMREVRLWTQETRLPDGRRVADQEWVQVNLARAHAGIEFLRLINWKVAWDADEGRLHVEDASTVKVFGTEHYLAAVSLLMEVVGERAYLKEGSAEAVLGGQLEDAYRGLVMLTFGGGVNEVQRDLIAMFGLGLPMAKR